MGMWRRFIYIRSLLREFDLLSSLGLKLMLDLGGDLSTRLMPIGLISAGLILLMRCHGILCLLHN